MGYGNYRTGASDGTLPTPKKIPGVVEGSPNRSFTEVFDLSKSNVDKTSGTKNLVARIPEGHILLAIKVRSTVSLGTSTLAFGDGTTADRFGSAAAYGTTPEAQVDYLKTAQKGEILSAPVNIWMTSGTANLPSSGRVVVEIVTAARG